MLEATPSTTAQERMKMLVTLPLVSTLLASLLAFGAAAQPQPITIGMGMALTGSLAGTGKASLVGSVRPTSPRRNLTVQFRGIVGNDIEQFKQVGKQLIVFPANDKSGDLRYPFAEIGR
jgi:hypothetical protein